MSEEENIKPEAGNAEQHLPEEIHPPEPVTSNLQSEPATENMEAYHKHHHDHPGHKKSAWKHYFFEFLMLFLAVTLGFFVENQREHYIEHRREKQYIRSLVRDVSTDTANMNKMVDEFEGIKRRCDSLLGNFDEHTIHFTTLGERQLVGVIRTGWPDFIYTDRTMQQLKNAGGLRLIRNLVAADSIVSYDAAARDLMIEIEAMGTLYNEIRNFRIDNFSIKRLMELRITNTDSDIEKMKINLWTTHETKAFDRFYNLLIIYRNQTENRISILNEFKIKGTELIRLLKKEYRMN